MAKTKKKNYFTQEHEDAIVAYALSDDNKFKSQLYESLIQPVFNELVDKIIYTYKFNTLPNIEILAEDCKTWLVTILDKFDPSKGYKAFSYFTVVTINKFSATVKKNSRSLKREVSYEDMSSELENQAAPSTNNYQQIREYKEFWNHLWSEIGSWEEKMQIKENDKKVYEAVIIVLNSVDDIEVFNKKAIYLYLREITKLNTKQIVNSLNKMRKLYFDFKKEWDDGKI